MRVLLLLCLMHCVSGKEIEKGNNRIRFSVKSDEHNDRTKRSAARSTRNILWRTKIVPYMFEETVDSRLNPDQIQIVVNAMRSISGLSCIKFKKKEKNDKNWLHIEADDENNSDVGKAQQQVEMGLDIKKISRGTVLHELLHTLGFFHEHARPDRNKYLNIYAENVEGDKLAKNQMDIDDLTGDVEKFGREKEETVDLLKTEYDYASIMHYEGNVYTKYDAVLSMTPRINEKMHMRNEELSQIDVFGLNTLYDCKNPTKDEWSSWSDEACRLIKGNCARDKQRFCTVDDLEKCPGADSSTGAQKNEETCDKAKCVVDGEWSPWSIWKKCSPDVTGIIESTERRRQCTAPSPLNKGKPCSGEMIQKAKCRNDPEDKDVNFSSFEDGIDLWHDASEKDQFMFRRLHQRFRRRNTGPVADDTSRSGYGRFMIAISKMPAKKDALAILRSPKLKPTSKEGICLKFWYHIYGVDKGSLKVHMTTIETKKSTALKEIAAKDYGDYWWPEEVNIVNSKPFQIDFEAKKGTGEESDVAIDDVYFVQGSCKGKSQKKKPATPVPSTTEIGCINFPYGTIKPFQHHNSIPLSDVIEKKIDMIKSCVEFVKDAVFTVKAIGVRTTTSTLECWFNSLDEDMDYKTLFGISKACEDIDGKIVGVGRSIIVHKISP